MSHPDLNAISIAYAEMIVAFMAVKPRTRDEVALLMARMKDVSSSTNAMSAIAKYGEVRVYYYPYSDKTRWFDRHGPISKKAAIELIRAYDYTGVSS
jgi:hypothetical protein